MRHPIARGLFVMRFGRAAPATIILAAALVIAGITWLSNRMFARQMNAIEEAQFVELRAIMNFNLQGGEERALAHASMIADAPAIRAGFAAGDRARLLADCQDVFQTQHQKFGIFQAQFATRENISFLRLHDPAQFGDDLSSVRPTVVAVNQDQVPRTGISLNQSGPALIGVAPVFEKAGKPIGIFEVGFDIGVIADTIKATHGFDVTFFVREQPLRTIATLINKDVFDEHNRVGEFLKYHSTNWGLMKELITTAELSRVNGSPVQFVQTSVGVPYGVTMVSLRNPAGLPIGILVAAKDFSATRAAAGRGISSQAGMALLALLALAGVVLVMIRGFLIRPLGTLAEGFGALSRGDASHEVDVTGTCEEIETLGEHYEALRRAAGAPEPTAAPEAPGEGS